MDTLLDALREALQLLTSFDPALLEVVAMTLRVTGGALVLATLIGLPMGAALGLRDRVPAGGCLMPIIYTGMGLPPVVIGLFVSLMLWRYGPLGDLGLMYTPTAMIIAQTIIAAPIIAGLSFAAILGINPKLRLQLISLGATPWQASRLLIREARLGLMAAVIAGFGRVISEVGASMMVGGNIKGQTRVLTTATVMEVGKGNY